MSSIAKAKMIYLAKRNPEIAIDDFPRRWRRHAALAAAFPNLAKPFVSVAQCTNARAYDVLPEASPHFDGVNLLTLTHKEAVEEIWNDPDAQAVMRPDELRVFSTYVIDFTLVASELALNDRATSGFCLITFLRRRLDMDLENFQNQWRAHETTQGNEDRRHILNDVIAPPPPGYEYDGISERWFDSLEQVKALRAGATWQTYVAHRDAFSDPTATVAMLTKITHAYP